MPACDTWEHTMEDQTMIHNEMERPYDCCYISGHDIGAARRWYLHYIAATAATTAGRRS